MILICSNQYSLFIPAKYMPTNHFIFHKNTYEPAVSCELRRSWSDRLPIFALMSIISLIAILDALAIRILGLMGPNYSIISAILVYVGFFGIFEIILVLFLKLISSFGSIYKYNSKAFGMLYRMLLISPLISCVFIALSIFQIAEDESYHVILIPIANVSSFIPGIIILALLVVKFVHWLSVKRDYIMISYTLAISGILFNATLFMLNLPLGLLDYDFIREPISVQDLINNMGMPERPFQNLFTYSSIISFILTWFATSILLRNYSRKVSKFVYWSLVSIPMIYFLVQYPQIFDYIFSSVKDNDPLLYVRLVSIVFGLTKTAGGLFFALGFWVIARSINNKQIRNYLILSGFGILLLYVATQSDSVVISPYPPFGIMAISAMVLASLLTFVGLYFTALSISTETAVRVEINKKLTQLAFVRDMGTSQMEFYLYQQVLPIIEKTSDEMDNVPISIEPDDVKLFVREALDEIKKTKS